MMSIDAFWENIRKIVKKHGFVIWKFNRRQDPSINLVMEHLNIRKKSQSIDVLSVDIQLYIYKNKPIALLINPAINLMSVDLTDKALNEYAKIEPEILEQYLELRKQ